MSKWKDKLRHARQEAEKQVQHLDATQVKDYVARGRSNLSASKQFRNDKAAQDWFNRRCKGHPIEDSPEIIEKGIATGEITQSQGEMIAQVLLFAGERAFR